MCILHLFRYFCSLNLRTRNNSIIMYSSVVSLSFFWGQELSDLSLTCLRASAEGGGGSRVP